MFYCWTKGSILSNIVDVEGNTTGISYTLVNNYITSTFTGAATPQLPNIPNDVLQTGIYDSNQAVGMITTLSGIDPAKKYDLAMIASRTGAGTVMIKFVVQGVDQSEVNAFGNGTTLTEVSNVSPNASGNIVVTAKRGSVGSYGYFNLLIVKERN